VLAGRFEGARLQLLCTNSAQDWSSFTWETNPGAIGEAEKLPHLDKLYKVQVSNSGELEIPGRIYTQEDAEQFVLYIVEGTDAYIPSLPVDTRGSYED